MERERGRESLANTLHKLFVSPFPTGDCNWITPCSNSTICFQNNTGCPVSSSYRVNPAGPCEVGVNCGDPTEDNLEQYLDSYNVVMVTLLVLTFVTILLGLSLACRMTQLNSRYIHNHFRVCYWVELVGGVSGWS